MKKCTAALAALLCLPLFSLAGQGFPGSSGSSYTQEDEYYLGRAVAANIFASYRPYTGNPEMTRYLNRICRTLAINSSRPEIYNGYHVIILDSPGFNAFATPGGHILITRALAEAAPSEDALAAIIAHELAHIILRHSMGIIEEMQPHEDLSAIARQAADFARKFGSASTAAAADRISAYRNSVDDIITTMVKNGYSREQEFEADNTALSLLADSGYDPAGLPEVLSVLQKVQPNQPGGFNSTHPSPADRIANIRRTIARYRVPDTRSFRVPRFEDCLKNK